VEDHQRRVMPCSQRDCCCVNVERIARTRDRRRGLAVQGSVLMLRRWWRRLTLSRLEFSVSLCCGLEAIGNAQFADRQLTRPESTHGGHGHGQQPSR
jgi:hypothetical protein